MEIKLRLSKYKSIEKQNPPESLSWFNSWLADHVRHVIQKYFKFCRVFWL